MTAVAVGVLIAAAFGSGDFAGGRASMSVSTLAVLAVAQACSVLGAAVLFVLVPADARAADLLIGTLAGVVNVTGLGLLYAALARHAAAVVAPVAAVVGSLVPVVWGLVSGERPSAVVLAGIAAAMAAAALVSLGPSEQRGGAVGGAPEAVAAGVALGSSLVLFSVRPRLPAGRAGVVRPGHARRPHLTGQVRSRTRSAGSPLPTGHQGPANPPGHRPPRQRTTSTGEEVGRCVGSASAGSASGASASGSALPLASDDRFDRRPATRTPAGWRGACAPQIAEATTGRWRTVSGTSRRGREPTMTAIVLVAAPGRALAAC